MPFPSEHAARLKDPGLFDPKSFRRVNGKFGAGVDVIFGKLKGGKGTMTIQTIRFDASKFTPAQVRTWLKDHKYSASVEAASGEVKKEITQKHLAGQHSQKRHGFRFGANAKVPEGEDRAEYEKRAISRAQQTGKKPARTLDEIKSERRAAQEEVTRIGRKYGGTSKPWSKADSDRADELNKKITDLDRESTAVANKPKTGAAKPPGTYANEAERILARTPAQRKADIRTLSKMPLKTLRKHQDLYDKQAKMAADKGDSTTLLSIQHRRDDVSSAIDLREFGTKERHVASRTIAKKELTASVALATATPFAHYQRRALFITTTKEGQTRWTTFSSSAFRDRDDEIVSTKALMADVERADHDGDYGPLRFWHLVVKNKHGKPIGVDIGDCDFNMMHGHILIESGTFRSPEIAQVVKEHAPKLEVSIGFIHPAAEPDQDGVYWRIRRFERSLVPKGRVANRTTRLIV